MKHLKTTRMLTMCKPVNNPYSAPEYADSLVRAEALEREIIDLCAQINAANYRFLQLIVALENEKPWSAWGLTSCAPAPTAGSSTLTPHCRPQAASTGYAATYRSSTHRPGLFRLKRSTTVSQSKA